MSEWVDIPLATQLGEDAVSTYASDAELTNLMMAPLPPGSRRPFQITHVPPLITTGITTPSAGTIRGLLATDTLHWVIIGTSIYYSGDSGASWTLVPSGTMPGALHCRMVEAGDYIVATEPQNTRVITQSASVPVSLSTKFFTDVTYQDGYTLYLERDTQAIYASDSDNPIAIDPLSFTTADALGGVNIGVISNYREVIVFKAGSLEYYYDAGSAGFPFARGTPGLVEMGCYTLGKHAICKHGGAVYWINHKNQACEMRGYQPRVISTPWVEAILRSSSGTEIYGSTFVHNGRAFYLLSNVFDGTNNTSIVYDIDGGLWHKRISPLGTGLGANIRAIAGPINLAGLTRQPIVALGTGGGVTPDLRYLAAPNSSSYNDTGASAETVRTMALPQYAPGDGRRTIMPELYLDMAQATVSGTLNLQWSDDGGATYVSAKPGTPTNARARWLRLGSFYQRILRFTFQIANKIAILGVRARIDIGE